MMETIPSLEGLRAEMKGYTPPSGRFISAYYLGKGLYEHNEEPNVIARAYGFKELMQGFDKHVYENDLIAGSIKGLTSNEPQIPDSEYNFICGVYGQFGQRHFGQNTDHFGPDYKTTVEIGVPGLLEKIDKSLVCHKDEPKKVDFLKAAKICMESFKEMLHLYAKEVLKKADDLAKDTSRDTSNAQAELKKTAEIIENLRTKKPETFREALQLIWLVHISFVYEGRYAMALGRIDQILYPFYKADVEAGRLDYNTAKELLANVFLKIAEKRFFGGDDVVNIAIGGVKRDGTGGVNELSYAILDAVGTCQVPGPNLSARLYEGVPDEFIDSCLKVIGTGLGYPALMNDRANVPALSRHGYTIEDARDYCMVGCIENFIQGKQPPWSDGRYNTPKYIELAMNDGICMLSGARRGPKTGDPATFATMQDFVNAIETQMKHGAAEYMMFFNNENDRINPENYQSPFLSNFCQDCIGRGLDINNGGTIYPSVHGAGCMGIGTVADALAAVEKVVYTDHFTDMATLRKALLADFKGYERLQAELLAAPKYGNNDPLPDKYAVWFVEIQNDIFAKYKTRDGGDIYTAIASNTSNIPAGTEIAATPDGRNARTPVSDAASPTFGRDCNGPTSSVMSLSKPDYAHVSCGSVINQKYSPSVFSNDHKRAKLASLIKLYFSHGGQEMQVNSVSRDILTDAIEHPEKYADLVVRVSGFSAYYNSLAIEVKKDILARTEHA